MRRVIESKKQTKERFYHLSAYKGSSKVAPIKSSETASFLLFPHKTHCVADGASFPEEEEKRGEDDGGERRGPNTYSIPLSYALLQAKGI